MSSAKQSLFKELDLDEPQWDVFSMTYDALKARLEALEATLTDLATPDFMAKYRKLKRDAARLAEATAFGVECQRALEISRDRLAEAERIVRAVDKVGAEAVANGGRITLTQGAVLFTAAANYLVKHHSAADSASVNHRGQNGGDLSGMADSAVPVQSAPSFMGREQS